MTEIENGERGSTEGVLAGVTVSTPQPIGCYTFLQHRITKEKDVVEDSSHQKFPKFEAIKFIKPESGAYKYLIRVDCGHDRYIDVQMNGNNIVDYKPVESNDPMKKLLI